MYLVTELVCWATGGPQTYTCKSMAESHRHIKLTAEEGGAFRERGGVEREFPRAPKDGTLKREHVAGFGKYVRVPQSVQRLARLFGEHGLSLARVRPEREPVLVQHGHTHDRQGVLVAETRADFLVGGLLGEGALEQADRESFVRELEEVSGVH